MPIFRSAQKNSFGLTFSRARAPRCTSLTSQSIYFPSALYAQSLLESRKMYAAARNVGIMMRRLGRVVRCKYFDVVAGTRSNANCSELTPTGQNPIRTFAIFICQPDQYSEWGGGLA